MTPKALNGLLKQVEGKPYQRAFNSLLLRAMMQATYTAENIGHYGLAAENYLHFTSPIRRYPDLMVHRPFSSSTGAHDGRQGRSGRGGRGPPRGGRPALQRARARRP